MASEGGDVGVGGLDGVGFVSEQGFFQDPSDRSGVVRDGNRESDDGNAEHGFEKKSGKEVGKRGRRSEGLKV